MTTATSTHRDGAGKPLTATELSEMAAMSFRDFYATRHPYLGGKWCISGEALDTVVDRLFETFAEHADVALSRIR